VEKAAEFGIDLRHPACYTLGLQRCLEMATYPGGRMINLILVAHGGLAEALLRAAEAIVGPQVGVWALGLGADEAPSALYERLRPVLSALQPDDAVLILADLKGGTPYNVAMMLATEQSANRRPIVIAGVSLAMLVEALLRRREFCLPRDLAQAVRRAGIEHIQG
jgi:mannose PTS system EIIA component